MKKSILGIMLLALVALVATNVSAAEYSIDDILVKDVSIYETGSVVNIERGESIDIRVLVTGYDDVNDVRVKAWIGGYEYSDIEATSEIFDVEEGVTYPIDLKLDIPQDIEVDDEDLTLNIKVYDRYDSYEEQVDLNLIEVRHNLNIYDVIFMPGLNVNAGDFLFVKARVENLGQKTERDIKVSASIPELGINQASYIDELVPQREEDKDYESSASSNEMVLMIPKDAKGNYDLVVKLSYQRGHELVSKKYALTVGKITPVSAEDLIVNSDVISQSVAQGKGVPYKISLTNLASESKTYSVAVSGTDAFATTRVDPSTVTLSADGTSEVVVFLTAKEDAGLGEHGFKVEVKEGSTVVKELNLKSNVVEEAVAVSGTWDSVKTGLEIGFIILLIILVILGLVLVAGKMRGKEEAEEPVSGETYY